METQKRNIMNIDGVVQYTNLSSSTIYNKISANQIPYHKIGHRTLFLTEEIEDWVRNNGRMSDKLPPWEVNNN